MKQIYLIICLGFATSSYLIASAQHTIEQAQAFKKEGKIPQAIEAYKQAIELSPNDAAVHGELGMLYAEQETFDEAIEHLRTAIQLQPDNINTHFQLGIIFCKIGRMQEAIAEYQYVLKKHPNVLSALYNIGYTLKHAGCVDKAIDVFNIVITKNPEYEAARLALAFAYLSKGDYRTGWQAHEWNLKRMSRNADTLRELLCTNNLVGKRIFLRPEGGLGDTINFLRYVQRLKELGATTIVMVQQPLVTLLKRCPYIDELLTSHDPRPAYDADATLMTLPAIFHDTPDTMAKNIPYIFPDTALVERWKEFFAQDNTTKIGICWQADVHNDVSRLPIARRGIPLAQFYQLADIPGISFYSIQRKEGLEQLKDVPTSFPLHIFDDTFDETDGNFMDTVAVMQNLDLIITIDTAVAHLAGALGRKVWLLLPYSIDWRWVVGRQDTPWYPSMRIFQQPKPFDWASVMRQVYDELAKVMAQRKR